MNYAMPEPIQLPLFPETAALTRIRPECNEWRYYRLEVWPDLFGRALLARHWGRLDTQGADGARSRGGQGHDVRAEPPLGRHLGAEGSFMAGHMQSHALTKAFFACCYDENGLNV